MLHSWKVTLQKTAGHPEFNKIAICSPICIKISDMRKLFSKLVPFSSAMEPIYFVQLKFELATQSKRFRLASRDYIFFANFERMLQRKKCELDDEVVTED